MEKNLTIFFATLFAIILITIIVSLKLFVFSLVMSQHSLTKTRALSKSDDLIGICYICFAYSLILFFKNGDFLKILLLIIYFIGAIILLTRESFSGISLIIFLLTAPCVYCVSSFIIPDYDTKADTIKGGLLQHLLIAETIMTVLVTIGMAFLLDIGNKIKFFIYSIISTMVVYIACFVLLFGANYYAK